jgi:RNA polymerase sigma-70 factor (ECF subfamily)
MTYSLWFGGDGPSDDDARSDAHVRSPLSSATTAALPPADAAIVFRVRAGDIPAFEALFRDLHPPLVRFARTCGVTDDEADDVVVDVFATVWESRATWRPLKSVAAYFFRATRNRALNALRDANVAVRYITSAAQESDSPLMGTPPERPDVAIETAERTAGLWDAIAKLPERQRVLLTLRWRDVLSIEEIAAVLGISVGATKTALTRAVQALRSVLPEDFR